MAVPAYSTELTVPEKALEFLEDVVLLDMTKYEAVLQLQDERFPEDLNGFAQDNIVYGLIGNETEAEAAFMFKNKTFANCMIGTRNELIYSQPQPTDVAEAAKGFIQRYQQYIGDPDFDGVKDYTALQTILDGADVTTNGTTTQGTAKLTVTTKTNYTAFEFEAVLDGVAFPWMNMEFYQETLTGFDDNWRLYTVGSSEVTVLEQEAVNIALDYVETFSWTAEDQQVTDFVVIDEPRPVELITTRVKEPLTLYPSWNIELYLDKVYPGNINRIFVSIWADTGEIISCTPLGGGGVIPEFSSLAVMLSMLGVFALTLVFYKQKLPKK
ncbi:MAG: hypothetical protein NWF03_01475 [Candidatus Bathyarchaeota archaeon]|nr:hypothetical protein [Candidatus Bathyarchaeota archaeon]